MVIAVFLISSVSMAQPNSKREQNEMPKHQKAMAMKQHHKAQEEHQAFLTEEQKESVKQLKLETAKKVKPLKNELRELKAHQQTLVTADKADLSAINQNIDKMSVVKTKIAKVMAAQHQEFRALLTEEQLLKVDTMKDRKREMNDGIRSERRTGERDGHAQIRG